MIRLLRLCLFMFLAAATISLGHDAELHAATPTTAPAASTQPADSRRDFSLDLGGGVLLEFVWVEQLSMWVGKYEVTNAEYRRFKPDYDCKDYKGRSLNGDRQPAVYVNFDDAKAFIAWINQTQRDLLPPGFKVRLPSEAEWLKYAQCGDGREYPWGNQWPPKFGNYCGQETRGFAGDMIAGFDDGSPVTCNVELSGKNEWGLFGVGGNVWESCAADSTGVPFGAWRGGCWRHELPQFLRCSFRNECPGSFRDYNVGCRLVMSR